MDALASQEYFISSENNANDAVMLVETLSWHNIVISAESKSLKPILSQINAKLNDSQTRLEGLVLLNFVLNQVSPQVFNANCQLWAQHLKKIVLHDSDLCLRNISVAVFRDVLYLAATQSDQNQQLASTLVQQFIPQLLNLDERYDFVVARALQSVMRFSPGPCRQHSAAIQKRLIGMLCVKNSELVEISSSCIAMLPSLSGGERGKTQVEAFSELYRKLCCSLQHELNALYENLEVDQQTSQNSNDRILFPTTLECVDPSAVFIDVFHRAISICACLQKLLSCVNMAKATVSVETTLSLVSRILKVTGKSITSRSTADQHMVLLFTFLPALHKEALIILNNIILSYRSQLLVCNQDILNLLYQTLHWTAAFQQKVGEHRHALSKLREVVYRIFTTWQNVIGSSSEMSHLGDGITRHMITDINCEENVTELLTMSCTKSRNKKTKKRKLEEPLMEVQAKTNRFLDNETCHMALQGLKNVVYNAIEDFKTGTFKLLCSTVINTLHKLQPGVFKTTVVRPYDDINCRGELYKLLLAIIEVQGPISSSFLKKGIHIFVLGKMDQNPKITEICCQCLASCRSMIEPIRRSLPEEPPGHANVGVYNDSYSETPLSDVEMEVSQESDISIKAYRGQPSQEIAKPNGHVLIYPAKLITKDNLDIDDSARSNMQESMDDVLKKPLPCVAPSFDDEEREKEDENEVVELEVDEAKNPMPVTVNPLNIIPQQVQNPGEESSDSSDDSISEIVVLDITEENEGAKEVNGIAESTGADAMLRSFVNSCPDDCDAKGLEEAEEKE